MISEDMGKGRFRVEDNKGNENSQLLQTKVVVRTKTDDHSAVSSIVY